MTIIVSASRPLGIFETCIDLLSSERKHLLAIFVWGGGVGGGRLEESMEVMVGLR